MWSLVQLIGPKYIRKTFSSYSTRSVGCLKWRSTAVQNLKVRVEEMESGELERSAKKKRRKSRQNMKRWREVESGKRTLDSPISTEGEKCQISHWAWNWAVIAFSAHIQKQSCIQRSTTLQRVRLLHQSNLPTIKRRRQGERGKWRRDMVHKKSWTLQVFF